MLCKHNAENVNKRQIVLWMNFILKGWDNAYTLIVLEDLRKPKTNILIKEFYAL
jgi:hypothetical protein